MQVYIKDVSAEMELKTKGAELGIYDTSNKHLGDLIVKKAGLEWCKGRTRRGNGVRVTWKKFISMISPE